MLNNFNRAGILALTAALPLMMLTACSRSEDGATSADGGAAVPVAPTWMLASAPVEADRPVGQVKADAAEGDRVVIRGRIGGTAKPIAPDVAVFHIVDPALKACSDIPGDQCSTPWDYCCEPKDSLQANTATIQVMNEAGAVVETNVESLGLIPLDEVIVVGTVGPRPNPGVLVIHAEGVYKVSG